MGHRYTQLFCPTDNRKVRLLQPFSPPPPHPNQTLLPRWSCVYIAGWWKALGGVHSARLFLLFDWDLWGLREEGECELGPPRWEAVIWAGARWEASLTSTSPVKHGVEGERDAPCLIQGSGPPSGNTFYMINYSWVFTSLQVYYSETLSVSLEKRTRWCWIN